MLTAIAGIIGIIATILAWSLNPKRRIQAELDSITQQLVVLYRSRDEALIKHDNDALTIITADIVRLCERQTVLLQRQR